MEEKKNNEQNIEYGVKPIKVKEIFYIKTDEGIKEMTQKELLYEIYKEIKKLKNIL